MIIPIRCFTCNNILGNKWNKFEKESNIIKSNNNLTDEEKTKQMINLLGNDLKLKRYCCRMILISTVDMTEIII